MKAKIFRISYGLALAVTKRARYLCWQPSECDKAARGMWLEHTEAWIRKKVAERLCTKSNGK